MIIRFRCITLFSICRFRKNDKAIPCELHRAGTCTRSCKTFKLEIYCLKDQLISIQRTRCAACKPDLHSISKSQRQVLHGLRVPRYNVIRLRTNRIMRISNLIFYPPYYLNIIERLGNISLIAAALQSYYCIKSRIEIMPFLFMRMNYTVFLMPRNSIYHRLGFFSSSYFFFSSLHGGSTRELSRVAASCAHSSINVACTCTFKSHCMRKNLQALAYKHFHVGILVIPHFHVHRITRFDQSSRLTALFSIRAQPDLHDIRSRGKIRCLSLPPSNFK